MARAISAQRDGLDYQARFFWLSALQLRTSDYVESVTLETDAVSVVDDLRVTYTESGITDRQTGAQVKTDYYQLKYHVSQAGAFCCENLLESAFVGTKESLLKRLYRAYTHLSRQGDEFRLNVVSNWSWDHQDPAAAHLREGRLGEGFYQGGPGSRLGGIRAQFAEELGIPVSELQVFLSHVRFGLGQGLEDLVRRLDPLLKLAGMKQVDHRTSAVIYDDLAWKLFKQGRNHFDGSAFNEILRKEKLLQQLPYQHSEVSICSRPQMARRPRDTQAAHLDLTDIFDERFSKDPTAWNEAVPTRLRDFLLGEEVAELPQPLHLFCDCHLSIAFLAGHLLDPKFGISIVPAQKSPMNGYELWEPPDGPPRDELWSSPEPTEVAEEVVVGVSVTHPVGNHVEPYLGAVGLGELPRLMFNPKDGIGYDAVQDGDHAWRLGRSLSTLLRETLPAGCHTVHLFFAGPVALAYILGHSLRYVVPDFRLYEHDFEGGTVEERYYPSIKLPL